MPNEQDPAKPIIVLFGSASGPKLRGYWDGRQNLGVLLAPLAWRTPWCRWWATDNDVFSHRKTPDWWCHEGESNWLRMLDKLDGAPGEHPPLFILMPDIYGDWPRTLERFAYYRHHIESRGLPIAIALQNGAERDLQTVARLAPDYVFVGGDVSWKWRHLEAFCRFFPPLGIKVHVGRASGPWRVRECIRVGAHSCDGTGWGRFADKMLPGLYRTLDGTDPNLHLAI